MIIGIDIDDVITNSSELITKHAKEYYGSDDNDLINEILHGNNITEKRMDFYNKHLINMQKSYELKSDVKKVIDNFRKNGHKVFLVTARSSGSTYSDLAKLNQEEVTRTYLDKHNIVVDNIMFSARDKRKVCVENNITIMVDDSVTVLKSLKGTNVKPLLFNSISNKNIKTKFDAVSSWLELEKYIEKFEAALL